MPGRVLLVDDDRVITLALGADLTGRGFDVDIAVELEEAIALISDRDYVAVVSDLRLTGDLGLEGLELLGYVNQVTPSTRTLLLTGFKSPEVESVALSRGAVAVLQKPKRSADIALLVERLLESP